MSQNRRHRSKKANGAVPEQILAALEQYQEYFATREEWMTMPETDAPKKVKQLDEQYGPVIAKAIVAYYEQPAKEDIKQLRKYCLHRVSLMAKGYAFGFYSKVFVKYETLEDFVEDLIGSWQIRFRLMMVACSAKEVWEENTYWNILEKGSGSLQAFRRSYPMLMNYVQQALKRASSSYYKEHRYPDWVSAAADGITEEFFIQNFALSKQPINIEKYREYERTSTMRMAMRSASSAMANVMPERYIDLFPMARGFKRHFTLHVGPTNSGKTYDSLQKLRKAGGGIYLAPLRLLAFEKYNELNEDGYVCSLLTGEERITNRDAKFQSSTIEMADFEKEYPLAVIDEAQMLEDVDRGCRWTAAILGICAPYVEVCMAPHALSLVIRLIEECGDSYEVVTHERNTELICEDSDFFFPKDVQSGDALIVFSRKNVHAVAAQLKEEGRNSSLIYGSLPYDVRQEQARLFREGVNDIVVATDAIGMGVNLPIRRVVLLETSKFDGTTNRALKPGEIQQIAGRAGRFGMYDKGFYTCQGTKETAEREMLRYDGTVPIRELKTAYVSFPETLLDIRLPVSILLKKWDALEKREGYITSFIMRDRMLALSLEQLAEEIRGLDIIEDRRVIYSFASIPFNERNDELFIIWREAFIYFIEKHGLDEDLVRENIVFNPFLTELEYMEQRSQVCDLLYQLVLKTNGGDEMLELVMEAKTKVSECIIGILEKQEFATKKCRICGRSLSYSYQFGYCERCFERMHQRGPRRRRRR